MASSKRAATRRKPAARTKRTKRTPVAKRAKTTARKGASRTVKVEKTKASVPPPPPADAIEVSGVWGRVMYSENDPFAEAREVFNHYDRNGSGMIEAREFARVCEALGIQLDDDELEAGLSVLDGDRDGKISWDEFAGWWRSR